MRTSGTWRWLAGGILHARPPDPRARPAANSTIGPTEWRRGERLGRFAFDVDDRMGFSILGKVKDPEDTIRTADGGILKRVPVTVAQ